MKIASYTSFRTLYADLYREFKTGARPVKNNLWQGVDVSDKPDMMTYELEDIVFSIPLPTENLGYYRVQIGPNLPWADAHFKRERVSGEPINPGESWKIWPWSHNADKFRDERGQYNHSYAERYWPKFAGITPGGKTLGILLEHSTPISGIRYPYGDLMDVIRLLVKNPETRNAYLPVWFPEDTGVVHGGRTPCSLGYLFRMRNNQLSIHYDIRSCDFKRHFLDDVYLSVRLVLWVLLECRKLDPRWDKVEPGKFTMHIGSLHVFANDWRTL